jgi:hypothetical protein
MKQRKLVLLAAGCLVLILFVVAVSFRNGDGRATAQAAAVAEATRIASSTDVASPLAPLATRTTQTQRNPAAVRAYTSAAFGFSLTYPSDLAVSEYDEGQGVTSIVFQKANEHVGFQIFVTPYPYIGEPITEARIKGDLPTLEMQGIQSLSIGTGTPALSFASSDPDFGPTQELWFAHGSYLFQVLTYPDHAEWLKQIIDTIRFP